MTKNSIQEFLAKLILFNSLTENELAVISGLVEEKQYQPGEYIFKELHPSSKLFMIFEGEVELYRTTSFGEKQELTVFGQDDFFGEGALMDESPQSTSAVAKKPSVIFMLERESLNRIAASRPDLVGKVLIKVARIIAVRMRQEHTRGLNISLQYQSGKKRMEHDLLGEREVPYEFYYGIQTLRAMENFNISGMALNRFPVIIEALAAVKLAAARANYDLGLLSETVADAIVQASTEIINGKLHAHFAVDMIQGGAGTSTNMNANEVIANRALEIMGHERGQYEYCHPNNHVNLCQSTNDAYPTAIKIALIKANAQMVQVLRSLVDSFRAKGVEFAEVIKMGRTQLQDAVPMTLGQAFEAYAVTLEEEIDRLEQNVRLFLEVNIGATAIGTGINAEPGYSELCVEYLREVTGLEVVLSRNLIEATQDTGSFVMYSSAVKRLAIKLSKISNDLRLLSSGPKAGFNEINLPPMQPGSSIMPGKVNPVIPEVVNQVAFKVIGNDLTVTLGAEAGQLELNVMEPVIVQSLFESMEMLINGMKTLKHKCIDGITANEPRCREMVYGSIGMVTALNPVLGYETTTKLAKEALETDRGVYELVLEKNLLTVEELDEIFSLDKMVGRNRAKSC